MITKEESERSELAIRTALTNQLPILRSNLLENLSYISKFRERWPTKLMVITGALLFPVSLALKTFVKIYYPGGLVLPILSPVEFTTLIFAAAGLLFTGALFSLFQAWTWRSIILAHQEVGVELLRKQVDIDKELLTGKNRHQAGGDMLLIPLKIRKRHHHR